MGVKRMWAEPMHSMSRPQRRDYRLALRRIQTEIRKIPHFLFHIKTERLPVALLLIGVK